MKRLLQKLTGILICVALLLPAGTPVSAEESHENPETAIISFSGISLFQYYANALDQVTLKDDLTTSVLLEKMPFANIPDGIVSPVNDFSVSVMDVSEAVVIIDGDIGMLQTLVGQTRLDDSIQLSSVIFSYIRQAREGLAVAFDSLEVTGTELGVFNQADASLLRISYDEVGSKLEGIADLLGFYERYTLELLAEVSDLNIDLPADLEGTSLPEILEENDLTLEELLELVGMTLEEYLASLDAEAAERLNQVTLTLSTDALSYYVGDPGTFWGSLMFDGQPMARREVSFMVGTGDDVTVETDAEGNFFGSFTVPFDYTPRIEIRGLYSPKGADRDLYLAALSPVIMLDILYYTAELKVTTAEEAWPGYRTDMQGTLNYGASPIPAFSRQIEVYIDDILAGSFIGSDTFTVTVALEDQIRTGSHLVLVAIKENERYAPVSATTMLEVSRVTPLLEMNVPDYSTIPGSVKLTGRLYSGLGALQNAAVEISFGSYSRQITTADDGTFETTVGTGLAFGLIGTQDLVITVEPDEPWHAPLRATQSVLVVNIISGGVILLLIVLGAIYLPRRIRRRLASLRARRVSIPEPVLEPERMPVYSTDTVAVPAEPKQKEPELSARERILRWYVNVIKLIQRITSTMLKPTQTLREFAAETGGVLGPLARYFSEFTVKVERLLYSRYEPTTVDVTGSQKLYEELDDESRLKAALVEPNTEEPDVEATEQVEDAAETSPEPALRRKPGSSKIPQDLFTGKSLEIPLTYIIIAIIVLIYYALVVVLIMSLGAGSLACGLPMITSDETEGEDGIS